MLLEVSDKDGEEDKYDENNESETSKSKVTYLDL